VTLPALSHAALPALIAAAAERASMPFVEIVAANIRNPNTRRAYYRAAEDCLTWCATADVPSIAGAMRSASMRSSGSRFDGSDVKIGAEVAV
jgi:Asp-tRNA(Asn)/Glu-tRNA(Gln) amidotransferase B subunit